MSVLSDLEELAEPFAVPFGDCSEEFRHRCEVKWTSLLDSDFERADYLAEVEKKRGKEPAQRLRRDTWELLKGVRTIG